MKFRIKLLSGNNIILVEADNYEAEIFMPCIVRGRINFMNVIPERRCCYPGGPGGPGVDNSKEPATGKDALGYTTINCPCQNCGVEGGTGVPRGSSAGRSTGVAFEDEVLAKGGKKKTKKSAYGCEDSISGASRCVSMPRVGRFSAGNENRFIPNANFTPPSTSVIRRNFVGSVKKRTGTSRTSSVKGDLTLPTPDLPRRAAPIRNDMIGDEALLKHRRAVRLRSLYHNGFENTPRKSLHPLSTSNVESPIQAGSHRATPMTDISKILVPSNRITSSTPIRKRLDGGNQESAAKWHKVLTPKVTYSRRGNHAIPVHDKTFSPSTMAAKPPSFLANPTAPPKIMQKVELKKRRLKVDEHVRIPTKIIKKRLKSKSLSVTTSNLEYMQSSLKHLSHTPMSAFDMLTNSNRTRCISSKLNQQFRKGCVNKASSTNAKYRVLSAAPPLKGDIQIQEISKKAEQRVQKPVEESTINGDNNQVSATTLVNKATSTQLLDSCRRNSDGIVFYKPIAADLRRMHS